jgi:hypothetical protein
VNRFARPPVSVLRFETDERKFRAVRADAVQEVHETSIRSDSLRGATGERRAIDVPVVRRQINVLTVGVEHVVVVEFRNAVDGDLFEAALLDRQPPQRTVTVQDEQPAVTCPVRCLEVNCFSLVTQMDRTVQGGD